MAGFQIGPRFVGPHEPAFLIAELSANHGQRLDLALKTVEAAAEVGADAIKIQTYTPETITIDCDRPEFVVRTKNEWSGRTLFDLYREAMTPWEWYAEIRDKARACGLAFFSSPFDPTSVGFLHDLGVDCFKVASFELTDLPLIEAMALTGKPMIISTGMATLAEVDEAVRICRQVGNDQIALLRCVSAYPADPRGMDLCSLEVLKGFGTLVGLSDHSPDSTAAIVSVALGAKVIEKHFIVDKAIGGPDAFFSLDPAGFKELVQTVRTAEAALGRVRFGPAPEEQGNLAFRRSLYAVKDIRSGETITAQHVRSIRPSNGLAVRHLPHVLGAIATTDIARGTPMAWQHFRQRTTEVRKPPSQPTTHTLESNQELDTLIRSLDTITACSVSFPTDGIFESTLTAANFYSFRDENGRRRAEWRSTF